MRRTRSGPWIRSTCPIAMRSRSCAPPATTASSAMPPPARWPTSSSSIWWPRRPPGTRRRRKRPSARRSAPSAITRYSEGLTGSGFFDNKNTLGYLFMVPAGALLLVFLTYPLGLGTWLGFTDAKIGRGGEWIGLENYKFLWSDSVTRLALFNTLFYTLVASVVKFALGLWLAILLNERLPFKTFFRSVILLP